MFGFFRREPPPPPPEPFYKKRPVATMALVLTIIITFVLAPVSVIYDGMAEELKEKANNETVLLYMKQQKETNDRQWKAIEQKIEPPPENGVSFAAPVRPVARLTPKEFQDYMNMSPTNRAAFKKLHPAYESLPN